METQKLAGLLESVLSEEFDRVGVPGTADVGLDEETIVIAMSAEQGQALLDALNRAEDQRSR
jgi:hypothetical protein